MMTILMRYLPTYWKPILLALALLSCVYGGWHARGIVAEAEQAKELRQAAEQRRKQVEQATLQDAKNEATATQQKQVTDDRTRKAYQNSTLPDRQLLMPDSVLLDIDAAATAP